MKLFKYSILLGHILILNVAFSCDSGKTISDAAIIEAVKQKYSGNHDDYVIKLVETDETGVITVADSIRIINESFEADRRCELDYANSVLSTMEAFATTVEKNRYSSAEDKSSAATSLAKQQQHIDSLQTAEPAIPGRYTTLSPNHLLVRIVKCKFSLTEPSTNRELTDTYDFYLSDDYKTVYDMKKTR